MSDQKTGQWTTEEFAAARKAWLRSRCTELSGTLADRSPRLHALLPTDLGDQRLVNGLVMLRIAADEARVRPVSEMVAWLELLIPQGHRHDLSSAVQQARSTLLLSGDPALWACNSEAWEALVLGVWRWDRSRSVEPRQVEDELVSRWGVRGQDTAEAQHPEDFGRKFVPLTAFVESEAEPVRLLVQGVLAQREAADSIDDELIVYEEAFQGAGHLALLAEQRLSAGYVQEWCDEQTSVATAVGEAFLGELSEVVDSYLDEVVQPVVRLLSEAERALLAAGEISDQRAVDEYLTEFFDCVAVPAAYGGSDGVLDGHVVLDAAEHWERSELTWHSMRGSVPVWYHIVMSPQERAAARAFSGRVSSAVIRIDAEVPVVPLQFSLFDCDALDAEDAPEDWYPEPGIEIRYSGQSPSDLCELLALARLGHARLEFLVRDEGGGFSLLRSLRAHIRTDDATAWEQGALAGLRRLVPYPDALADAVARESEEGDGAEDDDLDDLQQDPADDTAPSGTPGEPGPSSLSPSGPLPEALLARVKAMLRLAEDPGATEAEAEAFLKKATELMAKYGIEQALLQGDDPVSEQPSDRVVDVTAPWMRECKRLLSWIADAMRCHAIYPGGQANRHRVHLFGFASDLQAVEVLYVSLRLQMLQGADLADTRHRPDGEDARAYKRSWMLGFVRAVTTRIAEAERAARDDTERDRHTDSPDAPAGRSVALVLADRTTAIQAEVASQYPKLGKARRTRFKGSGYHQGHADGQQANIGGSALVDMDDEPELLV